MRILVSALIPFLLFSLPGHARNSITLSAKGKTGYSILSPKDASKIEKFAASELAHYLGRISGAEFIVDSRPGKRRITMTLDDSLESEQSEISVEGNSIMLKGGDERGLLYAVYDFLGRLGCRWVAPEFSFFEGTSTFIPEIAKITYAADADVSARPEMKYRKLYVEEGLTHSEESLLQLIDWMPKLKYNTLVIPLNYLGMGIVKWDNWRERLTPELEKRGIMIEVGGHGYNNFLNAEMENGRLFEQHPEWFGMDAEGNRSRSHKVVFCTSNRDAVDYLLKNLLSYLKGHPEIDIFDFWPPDGDRWCTCEECRDESATDRHCRLVALTAEFLKKELPNLKLECLAYNRYVDPPFREKLPDYVLLDFCAYRQNFEYQFYQREDKNNAMYADALGRWREVFDGEMSIYSYYRKYIWLSLPNIFPHYMQKDLKYYRDVGVTGISIYSEPGDWFTYGPNYYVLGHLAQDPDADVEKIMEEYSKQVFGPAWETALSVYSDLENVVRFGTRFPHSTTKRPEQYDEYEAVMRRAFECVVAEKAKYVSSETVHHHLERLALMVEYTIMSIGEMKQEAIRNSSIRWAKMSDEVKAFFLKNKDKGLFVLRDPELYSY